MPFGVKTKAEVSTATVQKLILRLVKAAYPDEDQPAYLYSSMDMDKKVFYISCAMEVICFCFEFEPKEAEPLSASFWLGLDGEDV